MVGEQTCAPWRNRCATNLYQPLHRVHDDGVCAQGAPSIHSVYVCSGLSAHIPPTRLFV